MSDIIICKCSKPFAKLRLYCLDSKGRPVACLTIENYVVPVRFCPWCGLEVSPGIADGSVPQVHSRVKG